MVILAVTSSTLYFVAISCTNTVLLCTGAVQYNYGRACLTRHLTDLLIFTVTLPYGTFSITKSTFGIVPVS